MRSSLLTLRLGLLTLFSVASLAAGCGETGESRPPPPNPEELVVEPEVDESTLLFDPEGNLLESDVVVTGLTLPRGLEEAGAADRRYAYRSSVPMNKLLAYFGPRLITGQVDRNGAAVTFRKAVPREARGSVIELDVSLTPMSRTQTRIVVREIPPVPENPPTEAELMQRWQEEQPRLD